MKALISTGVFVPAPAIGTGAVPEGGFSRSADDSFTRPSARVGDGGSIEARHFSGR